MLCIRLPSDFSYIRPLRSNVVECIRSYENPLKSMNINQNKKKSDENRVKINEILSTANDNS